MCRDQYRFPREGGCLSKDGFRTGSRSGIKKVNTFRKTTDAPDNLILSDFPPGNYSSAEESHFFIKFIGRPSSKSSLLSVHSSFYRRDPKKRPRTPLFGQARLRIRRKPKKGGTRSGPPFGKIQRFWIRRRRYQRPGRPPRSSQRPRRPRGARGDRPGRRRPPLCSSSDR